MKIDSNSTFLDFANSKIEIKVKAIESNQEDGSKPFLHKVKKILKSSLDLIPSPSPSVKIQIMGRKVYLRCKGR